MAVRGGAFYCVDAKTGKRTSLQTSNEDEARQIIQAKNQAQRQPVLNLQIAKAYLAGTDSGISHAHLAAGLEALIASKRGGIKCAGKLPQTTRRSTSSGTGSSSKPRLKLS